GKEQRIHVTSQPVDVIGQGHRSSADDEQLPSPQLRRTGRTAPGTGHVPRPPRVARLCSCPGQITGRDEYAAPPKRLRALPVGVSVEDRRDNWIPGSATAARVRCPGRRRPAVPLGQIPRECRKRGIELDRTGQWRLDGEYFDSGIG